jgi:hypothetical protein
MGPGALGAPRGSLRACHMRQWWVRAPPAHPALLCTSPSSAPRQAGQQVQEGEQQQQQQQQQQQTSKQQQGKGGRAVGVSAAQDGRSKGLIDTNPPRGAAAAPAPCVRPRPGGRILARPSGARTAPNCNVRGAPGCRQLTSAAPPRACGALQAPAAPFTRPRPPFGARAPRRAAAQAPAISSLRTCACATGFSATGAPSRAGLALSSSTCRCWRARSSLCARRARRLLTSCTTLRCEARDGASSSGGGDAGAPAPAAPRRGLYGAIPSPLSPRAVQLEGGVWWVRAAPVPGAPRRSAHRARRGWRAGPGAVGSQGPARLAHRARRGWLTGPGAVGAQGHSPSFFSL